MQPCFDFRKGFSCDAGSNLKCDTVPHPSEGAVRSEMSAGCCAIEPLESPLFFGISTWHRSSKVK